MVGGGAHNVLKEQLARALGIVGMVAHVADYALQDGVARELQGFQRNVTGGA